MGVNYRLPNVVTRRLGLAGRMPFVAAARPYGNKLQYGINAPTAQVRKNYGYDRLDRR
jgi:hypothetical protein